MTMYDNPFQSSQRKLYFSRINCIVKIRRKCVYFENLLSDNNVNDDNELAEHGMI